jgi:hypothetical protein
LIIKRVEHFQSFHSLLFHILSKKKFKFPEEVILFAEVVVCVVFVADDDVVVESVVVMSVVVVVVLKMENKHPEHFWSA